MSKPVILLLLAIYLATYLCEAKYVEDPYEVIDKPKQFQALFGVFDAPLSCIRGQYDPVCIKHQGHTYMFKNIECVHLLENLGLSMDYCGDGACKQDSCESWDMEELNQYPI